MAIYTWMVRACPTKCFGHDGYNVAVKDYKLIRVGCSDNCSRHCSTSGIPTVGAHARRKFHDVVKVQKDSTKTGRAHMAMNDIQKLYRIEREIEDASIDERYRVRQEKSLPLLKAFKAWLDDAVLRVTPKSLLGQAIRYTLNEWEHVVG